MEALTFVDIRRYTVTGEKLVGILNDFCTAMYACEECPLHDKDTCLKDKWHTEVNSETRDAIWANILKRLQTDSINRVRHLVNNLNTCDCPHIVTIDGKEDSNGQS